MGIHDGHRDRMRDKLIKNGEEVLHDHEILEMLLYHSVPRKDTNELAHRLIEHFGSLSGVFSASVDALSEIEGVGRNTAVLIKLVSSVNRRAAIGEMDKSEKYDTLEKLGKLMVNYFVGAEVEKTYLVLLDNSMRLIDIVLLGEGTVNESPFPVRRLVEEAVRKNASCVLLAHNHPNGLPVPSGSDIEFTHQLDNLLSMIGIPLLESIVVASGRYAPILRMQKGMFRASPFGDDGKFYREFYGE